jgi:hypothetical protein
MTDPAITTTRAELAAAITRVTADLDTPMPLDPAALAGEIITELAEPSPPVHYRWPPACREPYFSGIRFNGRIDKVTCEGCKDAATGEGA